jgi:hypothetical protein
MEIEGNEGSGLTIYRVIILKNELTWGFSTASYRERMQSFSVLELASFLPAFRRPAGSCKGSGDTGRCHTRTFLEDDLGKTKRYIYRKEESTVGRYSQRLRYKFSTSNEPVFKAQLAQPLSY